MVFSRMFCFRRRFDMTRWIGIWALSILFFWGISVGWALDLNLPETAYQGDLVVGRSDPAAQVWVKGKRQTVGPQGHFVLPVPRDQKTDFRVTVKTDDRNPVPHCPHIGLPLAYAEYQGPAPKVCHAAPGTAEKGRIGQQKSPICARQPSLPRPILHPQRVYQTCQRHRDQPLWSQQGIERQTQKLPFRRRHCSTPWPSCALPGRRNCQAG